MAAANPCRCGHLADASRACARSPDCGADYLGRISGPLMDRFDLRVEAPPVSVEDLALPRAGEGTRRFRLSARGYHRVLRVARTIADLEASEPVEKRHVAEAVGYRLAF